MSTQDITKTMRKIKLKKAPRYCNVLYNNEKTTVNFVMYALIHIFDLSPTDAEAKTLEIHESKKGTVFIGSKEVCDGKKMLLDSLKKQNNERHLEHSVVVYE